MTAPDTPSTPSPPPAPEPSPKRRRQFTTTHLMMLVTALLGVAGTIGAAVITGDQLSNGATLLSQPTVAATSGVRPGGPIFSTDFALPPSPFRTSPLQADAPLLVGGELVSGEYVLQVEGLRVDTWYVIRGPDLPNSAPYAVDLDMRASGTQTGLAYGIAVLQTSDTRTGLAFVLDPAGGYFAGESDSSRAMRVLANQPSPAVKKGGASNHLRVEVRGRMIKLFVNGQDVQTVNNGAIERGKITLCFMLLGVAPGMPSAARDARVYFDNVTVTELP